jgi:GMP synthase (glutamine-hydrolysing)
MTDALPDAPSPRAAKPLLIVATGRTFADLRTTLGDFDDWIARGLQSTLPQQRLLACDGAVYPDPATVAGVVVSGSHAMVTDRADWSERLAAWLRDCVALGVPTLGICYGHQLLAHALGGQVGPLPGGPEVGTQRIALAAAAAHDPLLQALPAQFDAQLVHYQSALQLPAGAVPLAHSTREPHQAFRVGSCAWGVQFHPEFSADAMRGYIGHMRDSLPDADALLAQVQPTAAAAEVLRRFADVVRAAG